MGSWGQVKYLAVIALSLSEVESLDVAVGKEIWWIWSLFTGTSRLMASKVMVKENFDSW